VTPDQLRDLLQQPLSDADADRLLASYDALARAVAEFPLDDLREIEPALRSTPGPAA
jgi:hypothetical protein